ncbi:MAG: low molecular weight phosphotyrosine protein phosphatase [Spirochaetaceae bacterium]|nr:low molecular weight phosphotyrosine protein phosphatase [Spirochaetaceae bacterium]
MIKILFVCHGNICRSTMAEYVMKYLVNQNGLEDKFFIDSAATSTEEIGNPVHYGTRNKLNSVNIPVGNHRARQITKKDLEEFDYLIGMDSANIRNMKRFYGFDGFSFGSYSKENSSIKKELENKICKLLEFADSTDDIADPWYTGNFDLTYNDVLKGCKSLLNKLS